MDSLPAAVSLQSANNMRYGDARVSQLDRLGWPFQRCTHPRPPKATLPAHSLTHSLRCARVLTIANGYIVSLPSQRVVVYGPSLPPFETVTEKIAKTGKEIQSKEEIPAGAAVPAIAA